MINPVDVIGVPAKCGMSSRQSPAQPKLPIDNSHALAGLPGYSGAFTPLGVGSRVGAHATDSEVPVGSRW